MHVEYRKPYWFIQSVQIKIVLVSLFLFAAPLKAQNGIIDLFLKSADKINKTLLNMTELSDSEENEIGKALDEKISKDFKKTTTKKFDVKSVFSDIMKQVTRKNLNYRFSIVKKAEFNAITIAGGKVYIYSGLLDSIDTNEELAFVIAREISHNELKHCIHKIQFAVNAQKINPAMGAIVDAAYSVYRTPYSKYDELDADANGVKLMEKAGYSRNGAVSFFEKLKKLEAKYGGEKRNIFYDFFASHPPAKERLDNIKKK